MSPVVLEVKGLRVAYGGLVAVSDANLSIGSGEIHGIIGPNGAGKTTFFNAISGLVRTSAGSIVVDGSDITGTTAYHRARLGIRRTFQSVQLIGSFTAFENVLAGLHQQAAHGSSWLGKSGERWRQDRVIETLDYLGLCGIADRRPESLSFAQQRYVEVARAIVSRPRILLLDEPAAGLSPTEIDHLDAIIKRVIADYQVSVVLIEHVLSLVLKISNQVTVFDRGKVIANGTPQAVREDAAVKRAYLGGEHA